MIKDSQSNNMSNPNEPLVTVIIPTFERPRLFRIALESVLNQTYKNLDIFITDNSHNDETEKLMQPYLAKDPRIKYEHHDEYDASGNWKRARGYNNPDAEYVNWLMDDDVFAPTKIEKMIAAFKRCPTATLVTSYRPMIDIDGNPLPDNNANKPIADEPILLKGNFAGKKLLMSYTNYIGEPTTVLIKKSALRDNDLGWSGKEGKYLINDWPTWLCCLSKGDMVYLPEALSYFRIHEGNGQWDVGFIYQSIICFFMEIRHAWHQKVFFDSADEYADTLVSLTRFSGAKVYTDLNKIFQEDTKKYNDKFTRDMFRQLIKEMKWAFDEASRIKEKFHR
ncbi:MAG: glycosyltransferase family 2 protein [Schwartzia sp.]|nr:glycosyltransferase family 2 protein [Schwartzia sp. (in: firmicutes)]